MDSTLKFPSKKECIYTSCYCEENIWHLAKNILSANKNVSEFKCYVTFVSNSNKCVPLWKQKSSTHDDGLVFWDYHVFLLLDHNNKILVFDLDSSLSFPATFLEYINEAIRDDNHQSKYNRYFRVIEAKKYLLKFSSDRRHMLNENDQWLMQPPTYPPILNKV
ncbi:protein N-terminal glutamine amidohydrolase isoform X2 [Daktulosphaira vitifoliae]|uniref:protein N-terminal glutamine amidohydrolase isoform X2 n=1 Tax=Daktulosphaira vitifoliae TaxID=58002 RepID=UPI0021A9EDD0|nr:protein N-terminal glutamine amidohydrolase isoform X2 [Daktulosphaira vitifoliae]